ncbi:S53 family peptidase [Gryllotalpicola koreensis]|uniref:S53 family peptidase n=1 Tax=Gryllotalpicola koreensis TaxID=993086 RepID=UPI0031D9B815
MPRVRARLALAAAATALITLGTAGVAAATPSPSPSWQQVPSGPTGSQLPGATAFGDTPGDTPEQVSFVLAGRRIEQLKQAVLRGAQPQLSVAQFANSYGQPTHDITALTGYLARFGIHSTVAPSRLNVVTTGTASAYNRALNVSQKQYRVPPQRGRNGKPGRQQNVHAPTGAPQLPPQLARDVTAIFGLSNYAPFSSSAVTPSSQRLSPARVEAAAANPADDLQWGNELCFEILGRFPTECNLPSDFAARYDLDEVTVTGRPGDAAADGTGQTIGIVTFAPYETSAAEEFWYEQTLTPQRPRTVTVRDVDGGAGPVTDDSAETDLDVEQAGGVAPGADIVVYQAPNTDAGAIDALFQAAGENLAGSVSMSWAESETFVRLAQANGEAGGGWHDAFDLAFLELAAQGQSAFVPSGDQGPYQAVAEDGINTTNLTVSAFAASPFVTAAGGTTLPYEVDYSGSTGATVHVTVPAERAWSSDYLWQAQAETWGISYTDAANMFLLGSLGYSVGASGGGYSAAEPLPPYQRAVSGGTGFTAVQHLTPTTPKTLAPGLTLPTAWTVNEDPGLVRGRATGRAVPDLSADADAYSGYLYFAPVAGGIIPEGGGTSFVAPQFAGAAAVINQANRARGGFWNPALYAAASGRNSPVTPLSAAGAGNDNTYYTGTPGTVYNPATGLGTPDFAKLAVTLRRR